MNDTKNPGDTLSVAPAKTLTLKRPVEAGIIRQSFSHGRSKAVVVEKVKRRVIAPGEGHAPREANLPAPPAAAPCSLSKKHWSVHNGSTFDVAVDTTGHHTDTVWCILKLKSTKTFFLGDEFHEWFVGVIIKGPPSAHATPKPTPFSEPCVCPDGTKGGPASKAGSPACEHLCGGHEHH
jgi:hypothetical protein